MPYHNFASVHIEGVIGSLEERKTKDQKTSYYTFTIGVAKRGGAVLNPDKSLAKTDWFECVCYNELLMRVLQGMKVGSHVGLKGALGTSNYCPDSLDKNDKTNWRKKVKVIADDVWAPIPTETKVDLGIPRPSGSAVLG